MLRQWSVQGEQAPGEPEPEHAGEELWEQEMKRLHSSQEPVRVLPYAMVDKRFIRWVAEHQHFAEAGQWGLFGTGIQSYFTFLRFLLLLNLLTLLLTTSLVLLPLVWLHPPDPGPALNFSECLAHAGIVPRAHPNPGGLVQGSQAGLLTHPQGPAQASPRFGAMKGERQNLSYALGVPFVLASSPSAALQCPGDLQSQTGVPKFHNQLWNILTGRAFNNTYLFYGAYRARPESSLAYSVRLAYLLSPLACLLLCFCGVLQRMVKGLPQKLFLGQDYRSPLSAKVFSSWDFCIQGQDAATIKKHEISNEFKVELEEGRHFLLVRQQTRAQRAYRLLTYVRVNVLIGLLVAGAISAIFWATKYSQDNKEESLFLLLQYLPPGVIALVNFLGPLLFVFLVQLENYPPNMEVNLTLIWCVVLKLASLGMFSFSLGQTVLCVGRNRTSCESYGYNACDYQCWENSVGEELYKLSIFNFLLTVAVTFLVSLPRRLLVERFSGRFWAWLDREEFLVPKNVLDIVEGQTVTWMGLFYCPLLPLLNSVFIFLTFYMKKYTLLRNSRASLRRFRASSSTFFFQLVLILGLLLATVPLGYVVSSIRSSWDCGLFTNYSAPWQVVPELVALRLLPPGQRILHYLGSQAFSFPLLVLLSLVLTVCVSQSQANARAIRGLRKQLVWQVQEKWHLVDDLSRLLPEPGPGDSLRPESPLSRSDREPGAGYQASPPAAKKTHLGRERPMGVTVNHQQLCEARSGDIEVFKKVVTTSDPASFSIDIMLKSRPDWLTCFRQAASSWGTQAPSTRLQLYGS
ncbi:Transmembrane channel-like protein 8 [Camelus dromedarius]|uniref:Transmembrane channel-like protein n=1 Tax=Camelus dromedarius TaxID=9838 RepID=A0A5N4D529_CAMDR|nr:Transmembrane channel-like protein 8 [Camelus dromedarius]